MKKIVYYSNTGHTEEYAKMLSKELNIEVVSFDKLKVTDKKDEIIFMSWVFASNINKLQYMIKNYNVISIIAVGMNTNSKENENTLIDINNITIPFFYLQGGVNYNKLKGFKKIILKMVGKQVIKENKPENKEIISIFKDGGNFVSKDNLIEVIKYLK